METTDNGSTHIYIYIWPEFFRMRPESWKKKKKLKNLILEKEWIKCMQRLTKYENIHYYWWKIKLIWDL